MSGANLRFGVTGPDTQNRTGPSTVFECHPGGVTEATIILTLGILGMAANIILMSLLIIIKNLRRWSQGLLFHQALVDCCRAAILVPLGRSIYECQPVAKCSLVETAFLLLVTVSTINMLTTVVSQVKKPNSSALKRLITIPDLNSETNTKVLNDAPLLPEDTDQKAMPLMMESPQCVFFGTSMIWFASITINLGPTFLSGALAANIDEVYHSPSCPIIMGPLRHYVLNVLWIITNLLVVLLTVFHLVKLYKDLSTSSLEAVRIASLVTTMISVTESHESDPESREHRQVKSYIARMEKEGVERVKMFVVVIVAYLVFWGPLFLVTLMTPSVNKPGLSHDVTLHVAYVHAFVNPALFLCLHKGLRRAVTSIMCCICNQTPEEVTSLRTVAGSTAARAGRGVSLTGEWCHMSGVTDEARHLLVSGIADAARHLLVLQRPPMLWVQAPAPLWRMATSLASTHTSQTSRGQATCSMTSRIHLEPLEHQKEKWTALLKSKEEKLSSDTKGCLSVRCRAALQACPSRVLRRPQHQSSRLLLFLNQHPTLPLLL
ncbi:G protein-coupled receptor rhodopsin-like [Trinorchestia longiramus]|nr:G protein-coupled receptor rhodopsin-like [Trinorchestia longiramus]